MTPPISDQDAIAPWTDEERCVPFIKGRVALYAILRAMGIGQGDEVVVPGFTCVVVPAAICYTGASPVFYDIDPDLLQGSPASAIAAMSSRTRAVLIQHNFGALADMGDLPRLCRERGISIIEDCAHAIGASKGERPAGTLADAAFASLQWSKPTTTGLGGIARANNPQLASAIKKLAATEFSEPSVLRSAYLGILSNLYRNWYQPSWYWTAQSVYRWAGRRGIIQGSSSDAELSSGTMPDDYQQRFGSLRQHSLRGALGGLPVRLAHRRRIWSWYHSYLADLGLWRPPTPAADEISAALRYPLLVENREALLTEARSAHVEIGDWFNAPLHPRGANQEVFGYEKGDSPRGEAAAAHIINLPTHPRVTIEEARRTIDIALKIGRPLSKPQWDDLSGT